MAFGAGTLWDVRSGGDDTNNGGGFDLGNANFANDLAATNANTASPVVTSVSYSFTSPQDDGKILYIPAGTNWIAGLYTIASCAGGAATLSAAAGAGYLVLNNVPVGPTTVAGCATVASPTGGTWGIDYSQGTSAGITFTDMAIDGTTNTKFTSTLKPVGPNFTGNVISVTSGSGFTVQRVQVASVSGTTATCDKSLGTLSSTGGHGGLGGALSTPGKAGGLHAASNVIAVKQTSYTMSATPNVAGGGVSLTSSTASVPAILFSWSTNRYPYNTDTRTALQPGANSTVLLKSNQCGFIIGFDISNPNAFTTCTGISMVNTRNETWNCKVKDVATGITSNGGACSLYFCEVVTGATTGISVTGSANIVVACVSRGGSAAFTVSGGSTSVLWCASLSPKSGANCFVAASSCTFVNCIADTTTGVTTDGFNSINQTCVLINCIASNCVRNGFEGNAAVVLGDSQLIGCAGFNNAVDYEVAAFANGINVHGFVQCSATPYTAPGSLDYTLNNTTGGGALLRAAGWPTSLPGLTGTNYADIGAFQHLDAPTAVINSIFNRYIEEEG